MPSAAAFSTCFRPGSGRPSGSISSATRSNRSAASTRTASAPSAPRKRIDLVPVNEMVLSPETISRFRQSYVDAFRRADRADLLYTAVSEGRRYRRHGALAAAFSEAARDGLRYMPAVPVVLDHLIDEAAGERLDADRRSLRGAARRRSSRAGRERRPLQAGAARPPLSVRAEWMRAALAERRPASRHLPNPEAGRRHRYRRAPRPQFRRRAERRERQHLRCRDRPYRDLQRRPASGSCSPAGARARATAWARCSSITG